MPKEGWRRVGGSAGAGDIVGGGGLFRFYSTVPIRIVRSAAELSFFLCSSCSLRLYSLMECSSMYWSTLSIFFQSRL